MGWNSDYKIASWISEEPTGTAVEVKIRTSNDKDMVGATDWGACNTIINNTDISSNNCVNNRDVYMQYRVYLSTDDSTITHVLKDINIDYESAACSYT